MNILYPNTSNMRRPHFTSQQTIVLLTAILVFLLTVLVAERAILRHTDQVLSLPSDDSFLNLATAKNLAFNQTWGISRHEFGARSTSLLFPVLLAVGFFIFGALLVATQYTGILIIAIACGLLLRARRGEAAGRLTLWSLLPMLGIDLLSLSKHGYFIPGPLMISPLSFLNYGWLIGILVAITCPLAIRLQIFPTTTPALRVGPRGGDGDLSFYAADTARASGLRKHLREYQYFLPGEVAVKFY